MDTRLKVLEGPAATKLLAGGQDATIVLAWFDPMLASHAVRLAELAAPGKPLYIVIADPPDPILPARARAELAASLSCVTRVLLGLDPDSIKTAHVDEREAESIRRLELTAHVRRRQEAG